MERFSDAELVEAISRGDAEALRALHRRYQRPLFGFCQRLTRNAATADELVNDTLFQVWRSAGRFAGRSKPSTWLFGIAYHLVMNRLRRKTPPTVELDALTPLAADGPSPLGHAQGAEDAGRLQAAMAGLSPEHRAVLDLAYAQGLSCQEIADAVGAPVNTVKTRLFYARGRLRETLPQLGVEATMDRGESR